MSFIRPAAVAGSFYPAEPARLFADLCALIAAVEPVTAKPPKVLIVPHAGYIYSGPIAARAYARLASLRQSITRVVLIGPAHRQAFAGVSVSSASGFQTPLGIVPLDQDGAARLRQKPGVISLDEADRAEHSLEVHLPFLQIMLEKFTLLPLLAGTAPDMLVADLLDSEWGGAETLIVVSSDLSHYEDYASATRHDGETAAAIERFDPAGFDHHGACGRTALGGLLALAPRRALQIERLDLRNSGDTAGPRDRVVGYGAWALSEPSMPAVPAILLDLARRAIASQFTEPKSDLTVPLLAPLQASGASFVTLYKHGQLRGCIGTSQAWRGLAEDVADNALRAAFADPRFPPLQAEELPEIRLSLSLISAATPIEFADRATLLAQLRPRIDGLILESGAHRALFLPVVWAQLPNREEFLAHLLHKAGLAADHWSDQLKAWRFTAEEFAEA